MKEINFHESQEQRAELISATTYLQAEIEKIAITESNQLIT
jgi:flagellar biosynthesis regulator FlaF